MVIILYISNDGIEVKKVSFSYNRTITKLSPWQHGGSLAEECLINCTTTKGRKKDVDCNIESEKQEGKLEIMWHKVKRLRYRITLGVL